MAAINYNVTVQQNAESIEALDATLRGVMGSDIAGVSVGIYGVAVHFLVAPGAGDSVATSILNAHNSLSVSSDKSSIDADGSDTATITCNDAAIAGDSDVDYTVWLDGEVYTATTSTSVSGGQAQLTLATQDPGEYLIEIKRQGASNYESGYVRIQVQEVS